MNITALRRASRRLAHLRLLSNWSPAQYRDFVECRDLVDAAEAAGEFDPTRTVAILIRK